MFVSRGLSCHCVLFSFVSTPVCKNGAGRHRYICSLFCLVQLVKSWCQVCAFMWTFCLMTDFCPLHHLEAKQVFIIELGTAPYCPLPHVEAEQVIFLKTAAFCPNIWMDNKTLYLNPHCL